MGEQKYVVYVCEATNVRGADGEADIVWFESLERAFEAVQEGIDGVDEFDGEWSWYGSIGRREVAWAEIEEVWGDNRPIESTFEKVSLAGEGGGR